ncbi:MAG: transposase [Bacteroidetes bacterium]|nr:transposase [Bacteroidota bacterium]
MKKTVEDFVKKVGEKSDQDKEVQLNRTLKLFIDPTHPLVTLAGRIPWKGFEKWFTSLYPNVGSPTKPIRLMTALLILKNLYNLGEGKLIPEWVRDPYFQYFSGETEFQWRFPYDPSDLTRFTKGIGQKWVERIIEVSMKLQGRDYGNKNGIVGNYGVGE